MAKTKGLGQAGKAGTKARVQMPTTVMPKCCSCCGQDELFPLLPQEWAQEQSCTDG